MALPWRQTDTHTHTHTHLGGPVRYNSPPMVTQTQWSCFRVRAQYYKMYLCLPRPRVCWSSWLTYTSQDTQQLFCGIYWVNCHACSEKVQFFLHLPPQHIFITLHFLPFFFFHYSFFPPLLTAYSATYGLYKGMHLIENLRQIMSKKKRKGTIVI